MITKSIKSVKKSDTKVRISLIICNFHLLSYYQVFIDEQGFEPEVELDE